MVCQQSQIPSALWYYWLSNRKDIKPVNITISFERPGPTWTNIRKEGQLDNNWSSSGSSNRNLWTSYLEFLHSVGTMLQQQLDNSNVTAGTRQWQHRVIMVSCCLVDISTLWTHSKLQYSLLSQQHKRQHHQAVHTQQISWCNTANYLSQSQTLHWSP